MTDKELHRYLEWVAENLPLLAMRDSAEQKSIIRNAIEQTQALRILLGVGGGLLGGIIGAGFIEYFTEDSLSRRSYTVVLSVSAGLVAYLASIASEVLVHRKIKTIAGIS